MGDGKGKKRTEIELQVADADTACQLLKALGYHPVLTVEKSRKLWNIDGCLIALDLLPNLGTFVEIEGPSEEKISNIQKNLHLEHLHHIKQSYAHLVSKNKKKDKT